MGNIEQVDGKGSRPIKTCNLAYNNTIIQRFTFIEVQRLVYWIFLHHPIAL